MTEQTTPPAPAAEPKRRSVGFPQLPLRESVDAIVTIGQHGPNHTHDAAAAYLGHSTANSGAFRTKLAALRDWGLLVRGDKDRVQLSELAQQLVLEAPEHEQARELLLAAFESCRVFGTLYNDSAKDTPLEMQRVRTTVVMRHGVASEQADKFVDSFIESAVFAGLAKFDGTKVTLVPRDDVFKMAGHAADEDRTYTTMPEEDVVRAASEASRTVLGLRAPAATVPAEPVVPVVPVALRQAWPIDGGEIEFIIRTPKALPPTIYSLMAKMAEVAAEMEALLKPDPMTIAVVGMGAVGSSQVASCADAEN